MTNHRTNLPPVYRPQRKQCSNCRYETVDVCVLAAKEDYHFWVPNCYDIGIHEALYDCGTTYSHLHDYVLTLMNPEAEPRMPEEWNGEFPSIERLHQLMSPLYEEFPDKANEFREQITSYHIELLAYFKWLDKYKSGFRIVMEDQCCDGWEEREGVFSDIPPTPWVLDTPV